MTVKFLVASLMIGLSGAAVASPELPRHADLDLGAALRGANHKFERRFRAMEARAGEDGKRLAELDLDAQEALWQHAKADETAS